MKLLNSFLLFLLAISNGTPNETCGEVRGFSLIYSGNFLIEADFSELGRLRINVGINPLGLQLHLLPGMLCIRILFLIYSKAVFT